MGNRTVLSTTSLGGSHLCSQAGATHQEEQALVSHQGVAIDDGGSAGTTASPFQIFGALLLTLPSLFARLWKYLMRKYGRVAEWLGTGLQNPLLRFNSGRDLTQLPRWRNPACRQAGVYNISGEWWNGIHATLKMLCQKHEGSSPSSPT